jgi:proline iminopeptidase
MRPPYIRALQVGAMLFVSSAVAFAQVPRSPAAPSGESARGVREDAFIPIGGIEQWVSIRGENRANPVIVVFHGGPAEAQTPLAAIYEGWYRDFTVVQWDQRGAGKTFGRNGAATPDVNLSRLTDDGIAVVEWARQRLGKKTVILLGHSWGAYLGMNVVQKRPDLFAAYVGTGFVVNWAATMVEQYDYAISRAKGENNADAVRELQEAGPPPHKFTAPGFRITQKWLNRYLAAADQKYLAGQMEMARSAPGFSAQDIKDWATGGQFSIPLLIPDLTSIDLPSRGYRFPVPVVLIQGAEDHTTPTNLASAYFAKLKAPRKKMVTIPGAGHFAYASHRTEFLAALFKYARPLAR